MADAIGTEIWYPLPMISPTGVKRSHFWELSCLAALYAVCFSAATRADGPDFQAQIQPLLQRHCYECHGPGARKSGLRLSSETEALQGGDSGEPLYLAAQPDQSLLIRRVTAADPEKRMPFHAPPLAAEEVALLKSWIQSGTSWGVAAAPVPQAPHHWAFQPLAVPTPPSVQDAAWPRHPLDQFILARLEREGLRPGPEADRCTLIRRLSLDLTGLPPAPEEIIAFLADDRPDAYERLVERLLDSSHYGERWALAWLDAARYADTNGFEKDRARSIWPYRDWVIQAFNENLPYDRFVVEQLAGDLLPNATQEQRVATGFLRNSMLNEEGGVDAEEFRYEAMVDRVNTTSTVFLGLTLACAQCHTHKYDPLTQREYYQFMAFLNNTDDVVLPVKDAERERQRAEVEARIATLEGGLESNFPPDDYLVETVAQVPVLARAASGAVLQIAEGGGLTAPDNPAEKDTYELRLKPSPHEIIGLKLQLRSSPPTPSIPGTPILSEVRLARCKTGSAQTETVPLARAEATFSEEKFEAARAIDGKPDTGWGVGGVPPELPDLSATIWLKQPLLLDAEEQLQIMLEQQAGEKRLLTAFQVSLVTRHLPESPAPIETRRQEYLARKLKEWGERERPNAHHWTVLNAVEHRSKNHATFVKQEDGSLLVRGDIPNTDTYELGFHTDLPRITAIRLEALPDPSLPGGGPGRGVIMTPHEGDFLLSEIAATIAPWDAPDQAQPITLQNATQEYAAKGREAALSLDGKLDTGWSVSGGEGEAHHAVFELAAPAGFPKGTLVRLKLDQYYVHQHTLGRLRVSATADALPIQACSAPAEVEEALAAPPDARTPAQALVLKRHFLRVAPELAYEHDKIADLRVQVPQFPISLVLEEREDVRTTHVQHRGEFLQPREPVEPGVPAVLHPFPDNIPKNRLTFARWLVAKENPLLARVTVNRLWQAFFG
ncbi:MAG: DUF1549 domain-containing protein, partial [Candidatus Hydrogenedentes bacterium]|nr:DUF1549 domain-containing protein [Candidatus Hydrogenedentota bacterium]